MTDITLGIIGLGYVGLPLMVEFSKHLNVIGFDLDQRRIDDLRNGLDRTKEVENVKLINALRENLAKLTAEPRDIFALDYYVVCVPTPVKTSNEPDMTALMAASELVGKSIKSGATVIFESTVYPGATEEICIPIIERESRLKRSIDFFYGYSPERINPGDKKRPLTDIVKVTSGCTKKSADNIDNLYKKIIKAGTFKAKSVAAAEAAKVFENVQRDVNIALVNELSILCNRLGIKTNDVLDAASTKWNFHRYSPGLVGGHCIGVDPYYLIDRGKAVGTELGLIEKARKVNESVVFHIIDEFKTAVFKKKIDTSNIKVLILGYTFKENCPDTRNTKVSELALKLADIVNTVHVYDPYVESENFDNFTYSFTDDFHGAPYDAVIIAVNHNEFANFDESLWKKLLKPNHIVFDLKGVSVNIKSDFSL